MKTKKTIYRKKRILVPLSNSLFSEKNNMTSVAAAGAANPPTKAVVDDDMDDDMVSEVSTVDKKAKKPNTLTLTVKFECVNIPKRSDADKAKEAAGKPKKTPKGNAKVIPIGLCSLPPARNVTLYHEKISVPLYERVVGDSTVIRFNATRATIDKDKGIFGFVRPEKETLLEEGTSIYISSWDSVLSATPGSIVNLKEVACNEKGFFNCTGLDAKCFPEFKNLPPEVVQLVVYSPRMRSLITPMPLLPYGERFKEKYGTPLAPGGLFLLNRDYTVPVEKYHQRPAVVKLPTITYGTNPIMEHCDTQVYLLDISKVAYVPQKWDKDHQNVTAPMESHMTYDLIVKQHNYPLVDGKRPQKLRIPTLEEYSDGMDTYPAIHPLVINALQSLHPIPRAFIGNTNVKKTVDEAAENYKPATERSGFEDGLVKFTNRGVLYFTQTYIAEFGIPCTMETLKAIYADKSQSVPYFQSDIQEIVAPFSKGTFMREKLEIPYIPKNEIGGELPPLIAFDLARTEYPDSGYKFYALELFKSTIPRATRRTMTPEEGHAIIMSHRRPDSVIKDEADDLGNIAKYCKLLPFLQPKVDEERANKRLPLFLLFALREDIKPLGDYTVDASKIFTSGAPTLPPTLPANYNEFLVRWLKAKYPDDDKKDVVAPVIPAPAPAEEAKKQDVADVAMTDAPALPPAKPSHERPKDEDNAPEPPQKRQKLDEVPPSTVPKDEKGGDYMDF
jgi:hypothetical protein